MPPIDLRTIMKKSTRKDPVLICFLFNIVLSFLSKTMPTQGVGFLRRKIDHRSIGVKGLLKKFRGYGYLAFHFRNGKTVAIGN